MLSLESQIENINDPSTLKILLRKLIKDPSSLMPLIPNKKEMSYIDELEEQLQATIDQFELASLQITQSKEQLSNANTSNKALLLQLDKSNTTQTLLSNEVDKLQIDRMQWAVEKNELNIKLKESSATIRCDLESNILEQRMTELTFRNTQLIQLNSNQSKKLASLNESLEDLDAQLIEYKDISIQLQETQSTLTESQEYVLLLEQQLESIATPLTTASNTKSLLGKYYHIIEA